MAGERETIERLEALKERMIVLKTDRTKFLIEDEIKEPYAEFEKILEDFSLPTDGTLSGLDESLAKPIKRLLLIFSLGFLTVGQTRWPISTFATLVTVVPLLRHLSYVPNFTPLEVNVIEQRLNDIDEILSAPSHALKTSSLVVGFIKSYLVESRELLLKVHAELDLLRENEKMAFSQVLHLRREIVNYIVDRDFKPEQLTLFRTRLEFIVSHLTDQPDGEESLGYSKPMQFQIRACRIFTTAFANGPFVDPPLQKPFDHLLQMADSLKVLVMTHRWTMRETDLYRYLKNVYEYNDLMISVIKDPKNWADDGKILKPEFVLPLFLIRKCLAQIYKLLDSAEPVTEALAPVHNQLMTTRRCLLEVKSLGGISSLRELYPYQMKLASLDNMRKDGKFLVGDSVPTGQGILNGLLAECFDLAYDLQVDLEERERGSETGDDNDDDEDDEDDDDDDEDDDEDIEDDSVIAEVNEEHYKSPEPVAEVATSEATR